MRRTSINVKFSAEGDHMGFTNVNFARSRAEEIANETGKAVRLLSNGIELSVIKPQKNLDKKVD